MRTRDGLADAVASAIKAIEPASAATVSCAGRGAAACAPRQ